MDEKQLTVNERFGIRLRLFRELLGKSREEMAGDLNFRAGVIEDLETGKIDPFPQSKKLIGFYRVDIGWLMAGTGHIFTEQSVNVPDEIFILAIHALGNTPNEAEIEALAALTEWPVSLTVAVCAVKKCVQDVRAKINEAMEKMKEQKRENESSMDSAGNGEPFEKITELQLLDLAASHKLINSDDFLVGDAYIVPHPRGHRLVVISKNQCTELERVLPSPEDGQELFEDHYCANNWDVEVEAHWIRTKPDRAQAGKTIKDTPQRTRRTQRFNKNFFFVVSALSAVNKRQRKTVPRGKLRRPQSTRNKIC